MRDTVANHKLLIIAFVTVALFIGFVVTQRTGTSPSGASYKEVDSSSHMAKGAPAAKVSIVQYSDFLCPSCSLFSTQVMPTIEKDYVETGKVKFEFRPMAFIADGSTQAGMGAYCAVDQDKFWQYHDAIYQEVVKKVFTDRLDPKTDIILTIPDVERIAANSGLDASTFDNCLNDKTHQTDILKSTTTANSHGIDSTPYILVNGQRYTGEISLETFRAFIEAQL